MTPGDLTPAVSDRVHYWVDRRIAEDRARSAAWLREQAKLARADGLAAVAVELMIAAEKIERGEHAP